MSSTRSYASCHRITHGTSATRSSGFGQVSIALTCCSCDIKFEQQQRPIFAKKGFSLRLMKSEEFILNTYSTITILIISRKLAGACLNAIFCVKLLLLVELVDGQHNNAVMTYLLFILHDMLQLPFCLRNPWRKPK